MSCYMCFIIGKLLEAGTSPLQIQVAESIAVFFTDPGDQSVLKGMVYMMIPHWLSVSDVYT